VVLFFMELSTSRVEIAGIASAAPGIEAFLLGPCQAQRAEAADDYRRRVEARSRVSNVRRPHTAVKALLRSSWDPTTAGGRSSADREKRAGWIMSQTNLRTTLP
jgi:hypothetical protein